MVGTSNLGSWNGHWPNGVLMAPDGWLFCHFHWFSMWLTACCIFLLPAYSPVHWHLCRGLPIGTNSFSTVPEAMLTLLIHGVFLGEVDSTKSVFSPLSARKPVRIIKLGRVCLANFSHSSLQASWKFAMSRFMDDMAELWRPYCLTVEMVSPRQHDFCTCSGHGFC